MADEKVTSQDSTDEARSIFGDAMVTELRPPDHVTSEGIATT